MKQFTLKSMMILIFIIVIGGMMTLSAGEEKSIYDFEMEDIDGNKVSLSKYKDQVVLVVNVASKCGLTPQYKGLQEIYSQYKDKGFVILGFPANNFLKQEPGTNAEIKEFCSLKFSVQFPMFSKISVKGKNIHPLYQYLTSKETNPEFSGKIRWNFDKFLVDRSGKLIKRFHPKKKPESPEVIDAIKAVL
jgi:glutathione peroxidase